MSEIDDWMNPHAVSEFKVTPRRDGTYYVIERKRRQICFGDPGYIESWNTWREFDNKAERDAELERLRKETPWHVRGRQITYVGGRPLPMPDPAEYVDF